MIELEAKAFKPYVFTSKADRFWSPPFDVVTPEQEVELKKNSFNITHITLPRGQNGIEDSSLNFQKWVREGILSQIKKDSIILLVQKFNHHGSAMQRFGVILLVRVNPDDGSIIPHEMTFSGPKKNRVDLMSGTGLVPEPIFLVVPDPELPKAVENITSTIDPSGKFEEPYGVINRYYILKDEMDQKRILSLLNNRISIVADGHHRLGALRQIAAAKGDGWNYAMAYIVSSEDRALLIAGIHRVVMANIEPESILTRLQETFSVKMGDRWDEKSICILTGKGYINLSVSGNAKPELKERMVEDPGAFIREEILKKVCFLDDNSIEKSVLYLHDIEYVKNMVESGKASCAVLMPDWDKGRFVKIVSSGKKLSQKSTFFYPKPPSGVAIYKP